MFFLFFVPATQAEYMFLKKYFFPKCLFAKTNIFLPIFCIAGFGHFLEKKNSKNPPTSKNQKKQKNMKKIRKIMIWGTGKFPKIRNFGADIYIYLYLFLFIFIFIFTVRVLCWVAIFCPGTVL